MIPKFIQRRSWTARMLDSRSRIMSPFYAWKVTRANLEAFAMPEEITGKKHRFQYVEQKWAGYYNCYYSDLREIESHFPGWRITRG